MHDLMTTIPTGIAAFIATNLDDIFILLLLFSQVNALLRRRDIIIGQYLGFTALILMSLSGFFGGMLLPPSWIGLLGLAPIFLGVRQLLNSESDESEESTKPNFDAAPATSFLNNLFSPQACGVAAMTIANGGDNIGIYVPLFATCTWSSLFIILTVFFTLVGVWCYIAYRLADLPMIGETLTRYGSYLVPFVLMTLGTSIMVENHTLEEPTLIAISGVAALLGVLMSLSNAAHQTSLD